MVVKLCLATIGCLAVITCPTSFVAAVSEVPTTRSTHRKWILKRRPVGILNPKRDTELVVVEEPTPAGDDDNELPDNLSDHEVVVEPHMLSVEAFLRTMYDEGAAYHGSLPLGATLFASGYGRVVKAGRLSGHRVGTMVEGMLQAADRAVVDGRWVQRSPRRPGMDPSVGLGLLGLRTGLTAYCGVFCVPRRPPRRGETVVVTGAAGAVGSVAVQLSRSTGARVVGVAGGPQKMAYLRETLGCDAVIDYKDPSRPLADQIRETCPDGIDFVYDNVGGETLDALLSAINPKARIVVCGAISQYSGNLNSSTKKVHGPSNYLKLAEMGAEMTGFNVTQYRSKRFSMVCGMLYLWIRGKVSLHEHVEEGLESFPYALQKLFTGETIGKTLVRVRKDDS